MGGLALAGPLAGHAQRGPVSTIGYLSGVGRDEAVDRLAAFRRGLADAGYREGRNVAIEFRWADGRYDRLPGLAAELVRRPVDVLVASGGPRAVLAAKAATTSLPIVFNIGGDPVRLGIVRSLARPGGNVTGVSFLTADLMPKRFELLRELVPGARLVALVVNPNTPSAGDQADGAQAAARARGVRLHVARAGTDAELEAVFGELERLRPDALLIGTDAFLGARHAVFTALAQRLALPTFYEGRNAVSAGGLMSYGPDIDDAYVQTGGYTGRILAGVRPDALPVLQPTKFELAINLKTARALGLAIPQSLRLRADEVVE
jgi:putative ABC transport system substrate-binding protein